MLTRIMCSDRMENDVVKSKCGQFFGDKKNESLCPCPCHDRLPGNKPTQHSSGTSRRADPEWDEFISEAVIRFSEYRSLRPTR